jgi:hypothetical protein
MKNRIIYIVASIFIITVGLISFKVIFKNKIYPVCIARYYSDTSTVLNNYNTMVFNDRASYEYHVKETILQNYSMILNDVNLDFQNYQYIISIGDSINYLMPIDDDCSYYDEAQAVIPVLSDKKSKSLYIFRLPKSPVCRNECG